MKKETMQAARCAACQRGPQVAYNRPHSLHKTKRLVRVNLQKYQGQLLCSSCRRTATRRMSI